MKLGVCYYPEHWPEAQWNQDFATMVQLGIEWVRIGEFAWALYEPKQGEFDFAWLTRALDLAHQHGLSVVLGTPTACPPKWLIDQHQEILAWDDTLTPRHFGSRRHYDFASEVYAEHCDRIVTAMAKAVGEHPAVKTWQTDNEFGCHDTIISYSPVAVAAFRKWCQAQYGDIATLNRQWGNVFWSMAYDSFEQIDSPAHTVTEANPAHHFDYWRFHTDAVKAFNKRQVDILRAHSPGRDILHNYMGGFTQFDHFKVGEDLDIATWDSYPIGFLEQSPESEEYKATYARTGDPDFIALHHDLYRAVGKGRWWVIEQQPGPVNWAPHNPAPLPGMVRLWTWQAFAHSAEVVSYFRFRQAPFAQEQFHSGLLRVDSEPAQAYFEIEDFNQDRAKISGDIAHQPAKVALVFDYASDALLRIQPQGHPDSPLQVVLNWYRAARKLGWNVDIVPPGGDVSGYALVLVPQLTHLSPQTMAAFDQTEATLIFGARCGSKVETVSIPQNLAPGELQRLIPLKIASVESLRRNMSAPWHGEHNATAIAWREKVETTLTPRAICEDGWGGWYQSGQVHYIANDLSATDWQQVFATVASEIGLAAQPLEGGLRRRAFGEYWLYTNHGPDKATLPEGSELVVGERVLDVADVAIVKAN